MGRTSAGGASEQLLTMDERFLKEEGTEVFTGNELLLKGALEAGCSLITGYPGSPVSEVFDAASANQELLKKRGVLAEMANNEALSVARLNGARMAGARAMAVMKSVGLHVAADGLALGNLSEPRNAGGSIVVVGDDPWIDSTQINNDSRFLAQHLHMPVLEPATFQEVKDWIHTAFELSSHSDLYLTYLITTHQADGGGTVWVRRNRPAVPNLLNPVTLDSSKINLDTQVLLPPRTWHREASLPERFERLLSEARRLKVNVVIPPGRKGGIHKFNNTMDPVPLTTGGLSLPIKSEEGDGLRHAGMTSLGFIASGLAYCYLEHALSELGLNGHFPILKLGLTYPVDPQAVLELAGGVDAILVIEEKRGFIEAQVLKILHDAGAKPSLWGKKFPDGLAGIPEARGLNPSVIMERLIPVFVRLFSTSSPLAVTGGSMNTSMMDPLLKAAGDDGIVAKLRAEQAILEATSAAATRLPVRTPAFCPGCPHRDSSSVFLDIKKDFLDAAYMRRVHRRAPTDLIFHGETGCFTMLMFEPNQGLMHNYSGMGLGGGTGAGADPFITNKQVVFLGDSTFFHSGMLAISDSIKAGQDITYVILDNKTTAMTGHQPTPGTELNLMGEKTFAQNIESIVRGMAGHQLPIYRTNPGYRDSYRELLEETILQDGVKIVIADKECGLTYQRRERREKKKILRSKGYLPVERHINVTPEACEFCLECTKTTGCPGLTIEQTPYGPKIATDLTHCVSDGACAKVKACPAFEEVIVQRRRAASPFRPLPSFEKLPAPRVLEIENDWAAFTAGVGGQGTGVVTAILVLAAHRQGYRVLFSEKKGLAVRNGSVFAELLVSRSGGVRSPLMSYGKADLILGIDLLEAARGLDSAAHWRVGSTGKTFAVVNTASTPTIRMLLGTEEADLSVYERMLRSNVRPDGFWGEDLALISEAYFGSKLYANIMLLGAALQLGRLPFSLETMESCLAASVPKDDRAVNLNAFHLGRALAVWPESVRITSAPPGYPTFLKEKHSILSKSYGHALAEAWRVLVGETVLEIDIDEAAHRDFALRAYELVHYEGYALMARYAALVRAVAAKDRKEWKHAATRAVIQNAFKVMAIKDEVYVAHLLTSPEKRARDLARYRLDPARGDRLKYRHLNRPELTFFGRSVRWDMVTKDWQLNLVKRMKFLRKLLPGWHQAERDFRDWYLDLVAHFEPESQKAYAYWVNILSCPEQVRGYREVRLPKMREARRQASAWVDQLAAMSSPDLSHRLSVFCLGVRK